MMRKARLAIRKVNVERSTAEHSSQVVIPTLRPCRSRSLTLSLPLSRPLGFAHDHSHRPVLAPAALAALPSTRAIETRSLPRSLAVTRHGFTFHVAFPKAPFPRSRRVLCRGFPARSIDALAPARLICYPHRLDRPSRSFPRLGSPKSPLICVR
jgi:hypothetical protein